MRGVLKKFSFLKLINGGPITRSGGVGKNRKIDKLGGVYLSPESNNKFKIYRNL